MRFRRRSVVACVLVGFALHVGPAFAQEKQGSSCGDGKRTVRQDADGAFVIAGSCCRGYEPPKPEPIRLGHTIRIDRRLLDPAPDRQPHEAR